MQKNFIARDSLWALHIHLNFLPKWQKTNPTKELLQILLKFNKLCKHVTIVNFFSFSFWHKLKIQLQKEPNIQPTQPKQRNPGGNHEIMFIVVIIIKWLNCQIAPIKQQMSSTGHFALWLKGPWAMIYKTMWLSRNWRRSKLTSL